MATQWIGNATDNSSFERALNGFMAMGQMMQTFKQSKQREQLLELEVQKRAIDLELAKQQQQVGPRVLETQLRSMEAEATFNTARAQEYTNQAGQRQELLDLQVQDARMDVNRRPVLESQQDEAHILGMEMGRQDLSGKTVENEARRLALNEQKRFVEDAKKVAENLPDIIRADAYMRGAPTMLAEQLANMALPGTFDAVTQVLNSYSQSQQRQQEMTELTTRMQAQDRNIRLGAISPFIAQGTPEAIGAAKAMAGDDEYLRGIVESAEGPVMHRVEEIRRRAQNGDMQGAVMLFAALYNRKIETDVVTDMDAMKQEVVPRTAGLEAEVEALVGKTTTPSPPKAGTITSRDASGLMRVTSITQMHGKPAQWFIDWNGKKYWWDGSKVQREKK